MNYFLDGHFANFIIQNPIWYMIGIPVSYILLHIIFRIADFIIRNIESWYTGKSINKAFPMDGGALCLICLVWPLAWMIFGCVFIFVMIMFIGIAIEKMFGVKL